MRNRYSANGSTRNKSKGIHALLKGSLQSHCNTLIGYSRIPNKYDHFHDKTYATSQHKKQRFYSQVNKKNDFNMLENFFDTKRLDYTKFGNIRNLPTPTSRKSYLYSYV